jgi:hypothetical protein
MFVPLPPLRINASKSTYEMELVSNFTSNFITKANNMDKRIINKI